MEVNGEAMAEEVKSAYETQDVLGLGVMKEVGPVGMETPILPIPKPIAILDRASPSTLEFFPEEPHQIESIDFSSKI